MHLPILFAMMVTTPFNEENPRRCQVPSTDIIMFTTSSLLSTPVAWRTSLPAEIILSLAAFMYAGAT